MSLTKIDICNHALLKVGADTIASLDTAQAVDEGTIRSAKLCNIFFDQSLEETLRMYPWNSCTKRATLSQLTDAPVFKYAYAYQLPNDCVRVINVYDNKNAYDTNLEYVIEGRQVLTNAKNTFLRYVATPDTVTILDPLAASALICVLASKLCTPLQLDNKMQQQLLGELETIILPQARSIDTFENKSWQSEDSEWIQSRYLGDAII